MNELIIRKLHQKDAASYQHLRLKALDENPENYMSSYAEEKERPLSMFETRLNQENVTSYGAFMHDKLVGIVTLSKETRMKTRHIADIFAMYVDVKYRRCGIGKKLMKHVIDIASQDPHIEKLRLSVTHSNISALSLYTSFGFKIYGTEENAIKSNNTYVHSVMMDLKLIHKKTDL